jgi:hypothetical protein
MFFNKFIEQCLMDNRTKITKSIIIAATTLVLTVALSSSQFVGSAFAQTSTPNCQVTDLQTGAKTCTGTVSGLEPTVTTCKVNIKKNAQTGNIIEQTNGPCTQTSAGTSGTVSVTITETVTGTCTKNGHSHTVTNTLAPFTTSSDTVSGGTQQNTDTTTRIVGQGQGSQGPGTTVTTVGTPTGGDNMYSVSGAPDLSHFCAADQAGFTLVITSIAEQDTFNFTPTA